MRSWRGLDRSWSALGALLCRSWDALGTSWDALGSFLRLSWAILALRSLPRSKKHRFRSISDQFLVDFRLLFLPRGLSAEVVREKVRPSENTVFYQVKRMSELLRTNQNRAKKVFLCVQNVF